MENSRERIYLAALLHDIGKFYQRADSGSIRSSRYLKVYGRDETTFCPVVSTGRYSHKHVLWTAQFIEDFSSVFKNLLSAYPGSSLSEKDGLMYLAAGHHLQEGQLSEAGRIIKEADCLSSGMDRSSVEALKDEQDEAETGWDSFKRKRMIPILQTIGSQSTTDWFHLPVQEMELSKACFPKKDFSIAPDYESLWKKFENEFKFVQANTYRAFSETLLSLLLKYTSCIPASTINFPDVSLYDHLKTTAALAVCLYDFRQSGSTEKDPFLLIGADFSGIQSYIYQIVSKYAGKNLKGRSFYLRLLSDAVVRYLLKELRLFQANVIYNSGGGFYLLAPNTPFVKERLGKAEETIEAHFFEAYGTSLFVAIDSIGLSKDVLMHKRGKEDLGSIWGKLFKKRERKKTAKFASRILADYESFFNPSLCGGDTKRDSITGEEFLPEERVIRKDDLMLKKITDEQIEIGKKLRDTNLIVVKEGEELPYWKDKVRVSPADLGFTYYFLNDTDLSQMKEKLCASADQVSVITLNGKEGNCDFLHTMDGINNIYSLEFYGGNETDKRKIPTFEDMCENNNFSRMGVLRMDVDNLGHIFQQGIIPERATLSRFAALSRSFDFFFSGYLNTIWKETDPGRSFIVYSGGDDVFIVGSWDIAIRLAERIQVDFKEFACHNPSFSLSGGVAIVSSKFPIMKGAEESAIEESAAKSHIVHMGKSSISEKNAISFMDMALNWDLEYPQVKKLKDKLSEMLRMGKMPKSFLSKLMNHYANAGLVGHHITIPKTYWMFTYDLSRMKERSLPDVKVLIDNCICEVCDKSRNTLNAEPIVTDYHALELWTFAARWAELEYRKDKE
ncbi:type III-A CRISPR-associated protein Cas10/Csm1 [uncultured Parabacteroides sp.]|uniref:type III-A CRISPR-associated protein Cas10/Csm1 n=1 Tax=uncultured Parabacteroides sp. TaxID=512312 RepID=UPI0025D7ECAA|nr:type III-A CRISPR-associated protein Cas10/Csm1 [uncultured Parabacteroides sp.]